MLPMVRRNDRIPYPLANDPLPADERIVLLLPADGGGRSVSGMNHRSIGQGEELVANGL